MVAVAVRHAASSSSATRAGVSAMPTARAVSPPSGRIVSQRRHSGTIASSTIITIPDPIAWLPVAPYVEPDIQVKIFAIRGSPLACSIISSMVNAVLSAIPASSIRCGENPPRPAAAASST